MKGKHASPFRQTVELVDEELGSLQHVVESPQIFPAPVFVPPFSKHCSLSMQVYPAGQEWVEERDEDVPERLEELERLDPCDPPEPCEP